MYLQAQDAKAVDPHSFSSFFKNFKIRVFLYEKKGIFEKRQYFIDINIADIIIQDKVFGDQEIDGSESDENGNGVKFAVQRKDGLFPSVMVMKALKPEMNQTGVVGLYMVEVNNEAQFDFVSEYVVACLSFLQILKFIKSKRQKLQAAFKGLPVSLRTVDTVACCTYALGLQPTSGNKKQ